MENYSSLLTAISAVVPEHLFVFRSLSKSKEGPLILSCNFPLFPEFKHAMYISRPEDVYSAMLYTEEKIQTIENHPQLEFVEFNVLNNDPLIKYGRFKATIKDQGPGSLLSLSIKMNEIVIFQEALSRYATFSHVEYAKYALRVMDTLISPDWLSDKEDLILKTESGTIVIAVAFDRSRVWATRILPRYHLGHWKSSDTERTFRTLASKVEHLRWKK